VEEWTKYPSQFYEFSLRPNLLYVIGLEVGWQKKKGQQQNRSLPTSRAANDDNAEKLLIMVMLLMSSSYKHY